MAIVFLCEVGYFFGSKEFTTVIALDRHDDDALQINFDIDLYDIECRSVRVVVFTQTADEPMDVLSQDFWLRPLDKQGRAYGMAVRPSDIPLDIGEVRSGLEEQKKRVEQEDGKEELDADWASSHDGFKHKSFDHVIQGHDFTFINFFAGWCRHCQVFAPEWARIAATVNGENGKPGLQFPDRDGVMRSVRLIKMNCVDFKPICKQQGIDAYPNLRLYKADGSFSLFEGKRNHDDIVKWLQNTMKMKSYGWAAHHEAFERGCNAKGRLLVPRVPGHLEIMAGAGDQALNPSMTNVSHRVRHLSFSDQDDGKFHKKAWSGMPAQVLAHINPLDNVDYVTWAFHQVWMHDLKVVSTVGYRGESTFQFSHQHRLSVASESDIPQVQFHYDIEPFTIRVLQDNKRWYDLCTALLANLGGIFVVMRLASEASLGAFQHLLPKNGARKSGILA
eukprot:CAMPEP_0170577724 /NCGR_PEP_ID=MMETSP0224-20130122/5081_1 /TAXON_ID=285029 /ORGANISM="Togula jolla, Strain CCCM 725" /LENGTH=446 /DNA_ID=CAMNT_0010900657 /DNA_START=22 /DNA_END=1362 /DNA_ORIENTATION=-